jgi:hypothetical protein
MFTVGDREAGRGNAAAFQSPLAPGGIAWPSRNAAAGDWQKIWI